MLEAFSITSNIIKACMRGHAAIGRHPIRDGKLAVTMVKWWDTPEVHHLLYLGVSNPTNGHIQNAVVTRESPQFVEARRLWKVVYGYQ